MATPQRHHSHTDLPPPQMIWWTWIPVSSAFLLRYRHFQASSWRILELTLHFYIEQLEPQSSMEDKLLMEYPDPSTHIRHNYNDRTRRSKFTDIGYIYLWVRWPVDGWTTEASCENNQALALSDETVNAVHQEQTLQMPSQQCLSIPNVIHTWCAVRQIQASGTAALPIGDIFLSQIWTTFGSHIYATRRKYNFR
jgi:hypothetical protein